MNVLREGTIATAGARLGYQDVYAMGAARDPLAEDVGPVIFEGERNREVIIEPYDDQEEAERKRVFLVKTKDPDHAYDLVGKAPKFLDHHGNGWGRIEFAVIYNRIRPQAPEDDGGALLRFQAPTPEEAQLVAIKKLNKAVVDNYLARGGHENPYNEIRRMQQIGDDIHVLSCIEVLEDETFLYIVTPFCGEGSLLDNMPYSERDAQRLFRNMLEILLYLERHGICHHDIAPDNFMFYNNRLVLFDFAMSLRIPREENGNRYAILPQGTFGTMPTQAPEVFFNGAPFDGVGADLWSVGVTLYYILTGKLLYRLPHPTDISFRFYILAEGLMPGFNNDRLVEILAEEFDPENNPQHQLLLENAIANFNIRDEARDLLINLLRFHPARRWNLMQAVESAWVQRNLP